MHWSTLSKQAGNKKLILYAHILNLVISITSKGVISIILKLPYTNTKRDSKVLQKKKIQILG